MEFSRIGLPPLVIESMFEFLRIAEEEKSSAQRLDRLELEFVEKKEGDAVRQLKENEIAREGIKELKDLLGFLKQLGVPDEFLQINFMMVRGLEYYTGPIYETVVTEPKIGSLTGGGRYDELIGTIHQTIAAGHRNYNRDRAHYRRDGGTSNVPSRGGADRKPSPRDMFRRSAARRFLPNRQRLERGGDKDGDLVRP